MSPAGRETRWSWLGRVAYADAVAVQQRVRGLLKRGEGPERLLLLEHPPVYTVGRNADEHDITAGDDWLVGKGVEIHLTDRGGQVTYHGPGQLVAYPIIDLDPDRRDTRRYIRDLQEVIVRTLAHWSIEAAPRPSPQIGVWVGEEKIASLGVHLSRWITTHGLALNVTTDLTLFSGIVPCGLTDVQMASVESLTGQAPGLEEVAEVLVGHFGQILERQVVHDPHPFP